MIEKIEIYLLIVFFSLLFFWMSALLERHKERIHIHVKKISRDTIIKIFYIWTAIIFLRKLTYYFHINGIIQTKDSILWMDQLLLFFINFSIVWWSLALALIINKIPSVVEKRKFIFAWFLIFSLVVMIVKNVIGRERNFSQVLILVLVETPLLLLKMLSSGKYLGLIIGLVTAYYIVDIYKKMKTRKTSGKVKFLTIPGLIIIGILISGFFRFIGDWQETFTDNLQSAKSTRAFEDLIDAAAAIRKETDKSGMLKEIALAVAKKGDIKWASSIAATIPDDGIRNLALIEIRQTRGR